MIFRLCFQGGNCIWSNYKDGSDPIRHLSDCVSRGKDAGDARERKAFGAYTNGR